MSMMPMSGQNRPARAAGVAQAQPSTIDEINRLLQSLNQSASAMDIDLFASHFWHDPALIYVFNGRVVHGWQAMARQHEDSWADLHQCHFYTEPPHVVCCETGRTAVATAAGWFSATNHNGERRSGHFILTLTCVRKNGRWLIVQAHESSTRQPGQ